MKACTFLSKRERRVAEASRTRCQCQQAGNTGTEVWKPIGLAVRVCDSCSFWLTRCWETAFLELSKLGLQFRERLSTRRG